MVGTPILDMEQKNINKNLLKDSKKISARERKRLANYIKKILFIP